MEDLNKLSKASLTKEEEVRLKLVDEIDRMYIELTKGTFLELNG